MGHDTPIFDAEQAEEYLIRRFGDHDGYAALAHERPDGSKFTPESFRWPQLRGYLLKRAGQWAKEENVFVCPVLRKSTYLDKFSGLGGYAAYADLDGGVAPDALVPFLEFVESGTPGNYHVYAQLDEFTDPLELEKLNWALKEVCKGDSKWSNASYLRLPGSFNYKRVEPLPVRVVQSGVTATQEQWNYMLKHYLPQSGQVPSHPSNEAVSALKAVALPTDLSARLALQLREPANGDRSGQSYRFIMSCFEAGLDVNQTYTLARQHEPTRSKYGKRDKGVEKQVLYLFNKAQESAQSFLDALRGWSE